MQRSEKDTIRTWKGHPALLYNFFTREIAKLDFLPPPPWPSTFLGMDRMDKKQSGNATKFFTQVIAK